MDQKDVKTDRFNADKDTRINVMVNRGEDAAANVIELNRVFHNMAERRRIYAWLMALCVLVGLCVPLLLAQLTQPPTTVSTVAALKYQVPVTGENGEIVYQDVTDLKAPDGSDIDLNTLLSSYVLSNALDNAKVGSGLTVTNLRRNVKVERILTEDSRRQQEVASSMITAKNASAYQQVQELSLQYENRFIVSLTNGFGDENARKKITLSDSDLKLLLDNIMEAYNRYLVRTYAFRSLPDDRIALADPDKQDILECLDLTDEALEDLYNYCLNQPERVKTYRSYKTGYTLYGLMDVLSLLRTEQVDGLYAYVQGRNIAETPQRLISTYQYKLNMVNISLNDQEKLIDTTQDILKNYQNDSVMISGQGSDTTTVITTTTDYYNQTVLQQAANFDMAARIEAEAADLENTLMSLKPQESSAGLVDKANGELADCLDSARAMYAKIRDHMEEIFAAPFYTDYLDYSAAQGSAAGVFARASRNMAIGAALGAVIALVIWFFAGMAPEFRTRSAGKAVKEA